MSKYTRKIVQGTSIIFISTYMIAFLSYILRLLLARNLTVEEFGLTFSIISMFGLFGVFSDFGLGNALSKFIPEYISKKQFSKIKSSIIVIILTNFFIASIIGIIFIIFSKKISISFYNDIDISKIIILYSIYFMLNPILVSLKSTFRGFHKFKIYSLADFSQVFIILLLTFVLLKLKFSILSYFISHVIFIIFGILVFIQILRKKVFPSFDKQKIKINKKVVLTLVKFGMFVGIANAFGTIFGRLDTLLLSLLASLKEAAYFQVSFPLSRAIWDIGAILTIVLMPTISEMWTKKHYNEFNQEIKRIIIYTTVLLVPLCIIIFIFSKEIILFLYGIDYINAAYSLKIFSFVILIKSLSKIFNAILIGIGHPEKLLKLVIFGSIINLILNLMLIPKLGSVGSAYAILISFTFIFIYTIFETKKLVKIDFQYLKLLKLIFIGIILILWYPFSLHFLKFQQITNIIISLFFSGIIYLSLILKLKIIEIEEIKLLLNLIFNKKNKL